MKKYILIILCSLFFIPFSHAQYIGSFRLQEDNNIMSFYNKSTSGQSQKDNNLFAQIKKRKTVNYYVGAGYSFVIFTNSIMNEGYPVWDVSSGDVLSEINVYFGFAVAKAVTLEIEPSYLWTHKYNNKTLALTTPITFPNDSNVYRYDIPTDISLLAFPLALNVRFFPLFQLKSFGRLFFVGGGVGAIWIREEYVHYLSTSPYYGGIYYNQQYPGYQSSTSQWQPLFRIMTGFTGSGGALGFGGEVRYNFIPLKASIEPFRTRIATNFNSVDIALRFYFSL